MAAPDKSSSDGARHFLILDALRFVLAFWVVLAHTGLPPIFDFIHPPGAIGHVVV
jgi:peptidoglycan/LPS O-acetylase OafA/YrhL